METGPCKSYYERWYSAVQTCVISQWRQAHASRTMNAGTTTHQTVFASSSSTEGALAMRTDLHRKLSVGMPARHRPLLVSIGTACVLLPSVVEY